jgi:hypothetical protein
MTNSYIVLAHLPLNHKDPIFKGDFALHPTEWVIFTGALAERQAESKAMIYRKYFHEVQIRTVSVDLTMRAPQFT